MQLVAEGEGIAATVALAEHLGDSAIVHLRVPGLDELLHAKTGGDQAPLAAGQRVGLRLEPVGALCFADDGRVLSQAP